MDRVVKNEVTPLYEHGLPMGRDLEQQLVGKLSGVVQQTFTHLKRSVLVHSVTH